ncbi:MAG: hypothetical protein KGL35_08155 [Bradyrhizobium sp.]|uniref:hypothetical protein n=1 Tax=Bradyrhizobium sp. TaxID=376 RepID=UPI001C29A470|nr:hypothetical protein [Bradyrhizobium sp.]MBU6463271.1 hypothetical protein [Pseudomonadota bacterium]MDE2066630.1 hypothetical protein [Bradyrhizobium sp.]MDE2468701.1 hypothetical protein [Bradyrhizobium sp.]
MKQISTIGLDLAKRVFQVHGAAAQGGCSIENYVVLRFFAGRPTYESQLKQI